MSNFSNNLFATYSSGAAYQAALDQVLQRDENGALLDEPSDATTSYAVDNLPFTIGYCSGGYSKLQQH